MASPLIPKMPPKISPQPTRFPIDTRIPPSHTHHIAINHVREYDSTDYIECDECGTTLLAHEAIDMDGGRYHEGCAEALLRAMKGAAEKRRQVPPAGMHDGF